MSHDFFPRQPVPPARRAARDILVLVFPWITGAQRPAQDIQAAVDQVLSSANMNPADAGLATQVAYGYCRHKGRIEFVLRTFLRSPDRIEPEVMMLMGMAVYEILLLDRIPEYASVDWAVSWIKAKWGGSQGGVANAVLRRVCRERTSLLDPDFYRVKASLKTFLSRLYSWPDWLVKVMLDAYGPKIEAFLAAQTNEAPLGLRINGNASGARSYYKLLASQPECVYAHFPTIAMAPGAADITQLGPGFESALARGLVSRQSAASQAALAALFPDHWQGPVLDACAGSGGKSFYLMETTDLELWCADVHTTRLGRIVNEAKRLGLPQPPRFVARADAPYPLKRDVKTILLDVPCSGLGVVARRPDGKWKRSRADLKKVIKTQAAILDNAFAALPKGGRLAYLTCTILPVENQDQVASFIERTPGAKLLLQKLPDPESQLNEFFYAALIEKM
ncbi:transcription antitermination factor NusB [Desulfovibrio inopinatus]|uniref:transcription antitermination factor NusB n=1 Tax=Desulfovibrio inopinatus TaxID=102109 RepID=UPI000428C5CB|nr:transcription antitermination factor NusB [Desulfovibrio inopinatus]